MSCLLLATIRIYEVVTGMRSRIATKRDGSSNTLDNIVLAIYPTSITVIGPTSAKSLYRVSLLTQKVFAPDQCTVQILQMPFPS
jgi:hypothetical protein